MTNPSTPGAGDREGGEPSGLAASGAPAAPKTEPAYPCKYCGAESPIDERWCFLCDAAFMTPDPEAERSDAPKPSSAEGSPEATPTQEPQS